MSDTTAPREYCSHCGKQLGSVRYLIVGSPVLLHQHCVEAWRAAHQPKPTRFTGSGAHTYDRDGYCDSPWRGY